MLTHRYDSRTFLLESTGPVQDFLLDRYRLTDEFRHAYGHYMLSTPDNKNIVAKAIDALRKAKNIDAVNDITLYESLLEDMLYTQYVLGFRYWEYFAYGFEHMPIEYRLKFMSEKARHKYTKVFNPDKAKNIEFSDKTIAYPMLAAQFKREAINIKGVQDWGRFKEFCGKHGKIIVKPATGSLGMGVEIIDSTKYSTIKLRKKFEKFINTKKGAICEELIRQDARFEIIHPESVNSLRIATYLTENSDAKVICAYLRTGQGDSIVDNAGAGGIYAAIDISNGVVDTDAVDERGNIYVTHPDTGFAFKNFEIPEWGGAKELVAAAARSVPHIRLIGWDVALSEDKGWQLIEGNCQPQINVLQTATKKGMREDLERITEWDKNRKLAYK